MKIILGDNTSLSLSDALFPDFRFVKIIRTAGQDNCDTYRIPDLVTTNMGTLIAVYDNRYNSDKYLQEVKYNRSSVSGTFRWKPDA